MRNEQMKREIESFLKKTVPLYQREQESDCAPACRWVNLGDYSVMLEFLNDGDDEYMSVSVRRTNSSYFAWDWEMPSDKNGDISCECSIGIQHDYSGDANWLCDEIEYFIKLDKEKEIANAMLTFAIDDMEVVMVGNEIVSVSKLQGVPSRGWDSDWWNDFEIYYNGEWRNVDRSLFEC